MPLNLPIVLASTSPRRHELLTQVDIPHSILKVTIDETQLPNESPIDYIERMVNQKAIAALSYLDMQLSNVLLITADTIGVLSSGQVLQKPESLSEALAMWQQMSDTTHEVWTAVQVSHIQNDDGKFEIVKHEHATVKTEVQFIKLTPAMMQTYWETEEPHDKAGGYAIQGRGAAWVKAINGSYSNVVGLPLVETIKLLNILDDSKDKQGEGVIDTP